MATQKFLNKDPAALAQAAIEEQEKARKWEAEQESTGMNQEERADLYQDTLEDVADDREDIQESIDKIGFAEQTSADWQRGKREVNEAAINDPRYQDRRNQQESMFQRAAGREAEQAGRTQLSPAERIAAANAADSDFRGDQRTLVEQLLAASRGDGPSLAGDTLKRATQQNLQNQLAMMAANRGQNVGQGMRQIGEMGSQMGQQAAQDAATIRLQEQIQARNMLGNVLQGARGQDLGLNQFNANLAQQAALANQAAGNQFALAQGGLDAQLQALNAQLRQGNAESREQAALGWMGQMGATDQQQIQNRLAIEAMKAQEAEAARQRAAAIEQQRQLEPGAGEMVGKAFLSALPAVAGGLAGGVGGALAGGAVSAAAGSS